MPTTPLRVAVVTPYHREAPALLHCCLSSVASQTHACTHFLVADGHPQDLAGHTGIEQIILPRAHGDVGNLARAVGSLSAMRQGFDAIAYLDADNWYYPNHIDAMVTLYRTSGAMVCSAARTLHRLDGSLMGTDLESDGVHHVDTSCLFVTRAAFQVLPLWALMPPQFGPIGDQVVWGFIQNRRFSTAHNPTPTVAFRTQYATHYQAIGEVPPPGTKTNAESTELAHVWWASLTAAERYSWCRQMDITIHVAPHRATI